MKPESNMKLVARQDAPEPTKDEIFTAKLEQGHREAANSYRESPWSAYQHPSKRSPVLRPDEVLNVGQRSNESELRGSYAKRAMVGIGTVPLWRRILRRLRWK
jgi:hypothetical protein